MAASAGEGEREAATRLLPGELLGAVFARLEVPDRCIASEVCRRWRAEALGEPRITSLQLCVFETRVPTVNGQKDGSGAIAFEQQLEQAAEFHRHLQLLRQLRTRLPEDPLPPPPRLTSILTAAEAARFLSHPVSAGVKRLVVRLAKLDDEAPAFALNATPACVLWRLDALAPALLARLERLELVPPPDLDGVSASGIAVNMGIHEAVSGLALHESAPLLRELVVPRWTLDDSKGSRTIRHPRLELLGATVWDPRGRTAEVALQHFPSLRRVFSLVIDKASESSLGALAAAGVRAARLLFRNVDLSSPAMAAAASALLQPAAFGPEAGRPGITLVNCTLPDDWPGAFPAGLQSIAVASCTLRPSALSWLFRGPHAASLAEVCIGLRCSLPLLRPREVLAAFEGLPAAARLDLKLPHDWGDESTFAEAMRALAGSERLLRAVDVSFSPFAAGGPNAEAWERYEAARDAARGGPPPPVLQFVQGYRAL